MSSKQNAVGAPASKKIRMTMACERCRSKKVKCDFAHPQCARCQLAKAECSYDGSATQVDLFNLVKLNETVDILQKRVQSIETDIKDVCSNTQYVANQVRMTRAVGGNQFPENKPDVDPTEGAEQLVQQAKYASSSKITKRPRMNNLLSTSNTQWSLSLTPKGLRIDTNIVSLHDLYDILLSGVSQFDISGAGGACMHESSNTMDSSSQSSGSTCYAPESPRPEAATVLRKKPLWKTRLKTFPLYSSWEPQGKRNTTKSGSVPSCSSSLSESIPKETLHCMISIFCECFLCFPCAEPQRSIFTKFQKGTLDPLLANAVFAWTARHAAIYHNLFPGKDPNQVGQGFFIKAKSLVKDRFSKTSIDTMHSLLIMYIYAIGIPGEHKAEVESEAYLYLGLAIRMCLDLKMNAESNSLDPYDRERNRRFFWVFYFLETLGSIHSDKPFALPPRNMVTVQFPTLMEHEKSGEARYRVEFMIQRFKITQIYRNIIDRTTTEKPLLSQISAIDKELEHWKAALPSYLNYETGDIHKRRWNSSSFREQACIKLNFEYNFQLCQLYGLFFSKTNADEEETCEQQPSAIEVLSREICLKAARNTVELLECWTQLKQLWCHFSLENLMMTTMIYGNILTQPNDDERDIAITNLKKVAKILLDSPVRHHKYVLTLVSKIRLIFKEILNIELVIDGKVVPSEFISKVFDDPQQQDAVMVTNTESILPPPPPPAPSPSPPPLQPPQQLQLQHQQQHAIVPTSSVPHNLRQGQHARTISLPTHTVAQHIQPISLTNQFTQRNPIYNVLDVAPVLSVFDMHKTDSLSEDMHFSDFVYTPTLLDYPATGMLSNMAATITERGYSHNHDDDDDDLHHHRRLLLHQQQQQGKKPDYTATVDDNYHRQHYSSPSQQQQFQFGYITSNASSSSTVNTITNNSPTQNSMSPPTWLHMEHSSSSSHTSAAPPLSVPILLNNPADDPQQPRLNKFDGRQPYPTRQQQQSPTPNSMKNYYSNYPYY